MQMRCASLFKQPESNRGSILESNSQGTDTEKPVKPTPRQGRREAFRVSALQIWGSRIGWKITIRAFLTLIIIQMLALAVMLPHFQNENIDYIKETGRIAVLSAMDGTIRSDSNISPISEQSAATLAARTPILGVAVYDLEYNLLSAYGTLPPLDDLQQKIADGHSVTLSRRKDFMDVVYAPLDLARPYTIAVHMRSEKLLTALQNYITNNGIIMLVLSGLVTIVLMLSIGRWLLEPVILLRNNLIEAAKHPETPKIQYPRVETSDEVGVALKIANDLIRQNAANLLRLRSQAEDRIHRLAYFDRLTNLPNRSMFMEKLEEYIKNHVIKQDKRLAIMAIDLDNFKDVNDTMGHEVGDKVLEAIAYRFVHAMPDNAVISRASADEFNVLVLLGDKDRPQDYVNNIFEALEEPISIYQESFKIGGSIGVSHCPDDGIEAPKLLKNADIALNRAKEEGRNTARYYSEEFDKAVQKRFQMLRDLRVALDEKQFQLHYQPQFDLHTGKMIGSEALLRWWKPDKSKKGGHFVSPADFIPVAEQSGLIVPIGEWVLRQACTDSVVWQKEGFDTASRVAVNISGVQFHRSNLVRIVSDIIQETGIEPRFLELEVTESIFMDDIETTVATLKKLHELGVDLAIDDFGTGYSSLSYLRQFPIDRLKIDQSFIRNALSNPDDMAITKTIISLGHSLSLSVIAEGVETQEHENFLKQEGCDEVQGFKYSKAIPAPELVQFMRTYANDLKAPAKLATVK